MFCIWTFTIVADVVGNHYHLASSLITNTFYKSGHAYIKDNTFVSSVFAKFLRKLNFYQGHGSLGFCPLKPISPISFVIHSSTSPFSYPEAVEFISRRYSFL